MKPFYTLLSRVATGVILACHTVAAAEPLHNEPPKCLVIASDPRQAQNDQRALLQAIDTIARNAAQQDLEADYNRFDTIRIVNDAPPFEEVLKEPTFVYYNRDSSACLTTAFFRSSNLVVPPNDVLDIIVDYITDEHIYYFLEAITKQISKYLLTKQHLRIEVFEANKALFAHGEPQNSENGKDGLTLFSEVFNPYFSQWLGDIEQAEHLAGEYFGHDAKTSSDLNKGSPRLLIVLEMFLRDRLKNAGKLYGKGYDAMGELALFGLIRHYAALRDQALNQKNGSSCCTYYAERGFVLPGEILLSTSEKLRDDLKDMLWAHKNHQELNKLTFGMPCPPVAVQHNTGYGINLGTIWPPSTFCTLL